MALEGHATGDWVGWYDRAMAGETEMHKLLKREACRWLYRSGYTAIAAEVKVHPLGIIDAVGTGMLGESKSHFHTRRVVHQVCFVECKASRGDFARDLSSDGQLTLALMERAANSRRRGGKLRGGRPHNRKLRQRVGLGKFDGCLAQPFANLHYVLTPAGLLKEKEIPRRWGWLTYGTGGIAIIRRAELQETEAGACVESAIARTLTMDIHRADDRAMTSVNRTLMNQQAELAQRIRELRPVMIERGG